MSDAMQELVYTRYVIFLVMLLVYLVHRYLEKRAERKEQDAFGEKMGCEPLPVMKTKWPLGIDVLFTASRHVKEQILLQFFMEIIDSTGLTHEQRILGKVQYNTIEPKNIEAVLSTQFENFGFGKRTENFAPWLGSSIFTQDGAAWKHSRALLRPQLAANREQNFNAIHDTLEDLIHTIKDDTVMDLQQLFYDLTLNTTLFLLFGSTMGYTKAGDRTGEDEDFAKAFQEAQEYISHRGRLGEYYWLANSSKFKRACETTHRFIDRGIKEALKDANNSATEDEEKKCNTFIDALRRKTQDEKTIRDQCVAVLLAGRDTTACSIAWAFRLLVRHPRVLDKLRVEVRYTIGLGKESPCPTRAILKRMSYLDAFIKEVLRLYPVAPVNGRTAIRTTTLPVGGGPSGRSPFLVRKNEVIGYSVYAMHRRKDLYGEDALEFRPERWEDGTLFRSIGWGYLPFNGGPRVCLGQEYALLELGYTIVRLIQCFPNMKLPEDEPVVDMGKEKQNLTLVLAPGDGCRVLMRS
ncbi:uncharacterized protein yc1106_03494 [Curvularia clavata]|uniref:Uncharacterized protein n=1 Tax=Curvularia clavata TaxID=95742 RepID=A0A9Q8Z6S6_CURCL|nr:uncharacterized protein yc1106_03494 [Curvularia clavata]